MYWRCARFGSRRLRIADLGYAGEHGYLIVSKDSDFRQLAFLLGPTPKAVWLNVGNCTTSVIADLLRTSADVIGAFIASAEEALLVLPNLDD